jgi:RHS repeat-associated protein
VQRFVSLDGTSGSEKMWSYSGYAGDGISTTARTVTVTSPVGDKVVHQLNAQGVETQTQWQTATGTTLKTVTSSWSQAAVLSNGQPQNPQVNTITTILDGGEASQRSLTYDANMNVTQDKITDWQWATTGSAPILQKDVTYTTIAVPNVTNVIRKSSETVTAIDPSSASFVQQGRTDYVYDEYPFMYTRSGVVNSTPPSSSANLGNVTTIKHYKDASNLVSEHMHYDNLGNVVQKIDALSNTTNIDFTDNFCTLNGGGMCTNVTGHPTTFAYPTGTTNALNQSTTAKYDYGTGLSTVAIDVRLNPTKTRYDSMNRVTSVTEPNGKVTSYTYDDTNRITTKTVTVDSTYSSQVQTHFDQLYHVTETLSSDPEGQIAIDATYDDKGRKAQVSNPYRFGTETPVWTTTTYDELDRPKQVQAPDNSIVQYSYTNNQTTMTDQTGNQRRYTYNVLGQMTMVEEPNPTLATPIVTTYSYYAFGPLYQSNQSGQTRTFVNNWFGQMTSQTLPESGTTTIAYDANGNVTSKTDARSMSVIYCYDALNRETVKMYAGLCTNPGTGLVTFGYDAPGYAGLKTSMTDAVGSVNYAYDSMNRLTQESRTLTGVSGTFTTGYGYNIKGDLTSVTYPSGRVVNFTYAEGSGCCNSRLASVVDHTTGVTVNDTMSYDAAGHLLKNTFGNGIVQNYGYNNRLQETSITAALGGTSVMNFSYNYGTSSTNTGRVLSRTDAIQPEHNASYSYDSIYRLASVASADPTSSWGVAWAFDTWGNRLSQTAFGLAANPLRSYTQTYVNTSGNPTPFFTNTNQVSGITYDLAGNQLGDGALPSPTTYTFNAESQMITSNGPGGSATYAYDGGGRRMKKTVTTSSGTETTYTFYGPGGIISEFTTSTVIANATVAASNDRCFYHATDKLGSAVLVLNAMGAVIENNRTLPYGEAWLPTDNGQPTTNDKKFTAYERDLESGLDYAMNRYDSNANGRFISVDSGSIIFTAPTSLNRYIYAGNDPVNIKDSTGGFWDCPEFDCSFGPHKPFEYTVADYDDMYGSPSERMATMVPCKVQTNQQGVFMSALCTAGLAAAAALVESSTVCPLERISANYTVSTAGNRAVHAIFAPALVAKVDKIFQALNKAGIVPQINDGFRTISEQMQAAGSDKYGQVPIGPHEVGMAIDIQITYGADGNLDAASQNIVDLMTQAGFTWGGTFKNKKDPVHFQLIQTPSEADVQECNDEHWRPVDDRPGH